MENPLAADKQQERFDQWLAAPGVEWASSEAAANYRARVQRIIDAVQQREPDQVPVLPNVGFFPAYYSGISFSAMRFPSSKGSLTVLLAEQNLNMALKVADYVYIISQGTVVHESTPQTLRNNQETKSKYLGV